MEPSPNTRPLWRITGITDDRMFDPVHGVVQAKRVAFETAHGVVSSVLIPDHQFNHDAVGNAVHDMASRIAEINTLEGPPIPSYGYTPPES